MDPGSSPQTEFTGSRNPLLTKQAIIVLREELEYFVIPPVDKSPNAPKFTNEAGIANEAHLILKRESGQKLLEKRSIFTALQRNVNKENNVAEQHLIDMLCMSGFNREDQWGFRALEPSRCSISSIALVLLKTGITHGPDGVVSVDNQQMGTAQKLLLFWRKPAVHLYSTFSFFFRLTDLSYQRKCWWDGVDVDVAPPGSEQPKMVKLWARRVWTLELSLVRFSYLCSLTSL